MIVIDGSYGEGGGQILRTSLALSLVTGKPFRMEKIRAKRKNPGLMRQHLTAVQAAAQIGKAEVSGDKIGSQQLNFVPGKVNPGEYTFAIGTAGSATLVFQTVLPALITASAPSKLRLEGGTHNPYAPPYDFLEKAFLPLLNRMGVQIEAKLLRPGFYPAGGGHVDITINPAEKLTGLNLTERGEITTRRARAMVASLPKNIAERELNHVAHRMSWDSSCLFAEVIDNSRGPGNIVLIELETEHLTEVFTGFGARGVRAEAVADEAVKATRTYLASNAPVGEYLADQLLIPLALAGNGSFKTLPLSRHTSTNIDVIKKFLNVEITTSAISRTNHLVEISSIN